MARDARAMVLATDAGLIHSGDQRRSGDAADRPRHESAGEPQPRACEFIDVGGADGVLAVAGKMSRHIFDDDPDDVRSTLLSEKNLEAIFLRRIDLFIDQIRLNAVPPFLELGS